MSVRWLHSLGLVRDGGSHIERLRASRVALLDFWVSAAESVRQVASFLRLGLAIRDRGVSGQCRNLSLFRGATNDWWWGRC